MPLLWWMSNPEHYEGFGCLILQGPAVQKLDPEDEDPKVLRNITNYLRSTTA